ncbi:precorrin-8X methylmutase [Pseudooceanicola batsensis HTCC2597]|uniref:Precorrin-8X methylmutase n=2 Tax=Pseudooceanicola batsensis TaxID=314255 RepID=A3TVH2_PSEBH|nr:precorrin-8X methylmutase [Pseudooceanicola batsensis HTCC2597]
MTRPLFDTHVVVDWSARNAPSPARPSKDAIWIGIVREGAAQAPVYLRTRHEAVAWLADFLSAEAEAGRRVLAGFDFPFGYPAGVAQRLCGSDSALALWDWLAGRVADGADNVSNRFEVAASINAEYDGVGPFWGRPDTVDLPAIPIRASDRHGTDHPPERRVADASAKGAKTVWQLAYAGSVGSQVIVGLPALAALRADPRLRDRLQVWPFDTGLAVPEGRIVLAEVYPSLLQTQAHAERAEDEVLDSAQVRVVAGALAALDREGGLAPLFRGAPDLTGPEREVVAREEAWILGLGHEAELVAAAPDASGPARAPVRQMRYERDPAEIYAQSFATVRREARLDRFPPGLQSVAIRLIHACGMVEVADRLASSSGAWEAGRAALLAGRPVLCDCEMVAAGVIRRNLPAGNEVTVTLNAPEVPDLARRIGNTRSAAAVELWLPHLEGAVVAIGNAPTALFHLLELLDRGAPKPAMILGFPVGFVGAAESKAELASDPRGCEFLALRGRRGGSAMASAAVNALAAGLPGEQV